MNSLVKSVKVKEQTPGKTRLDNTGIFLIVVREFISIYSKYTSKHTQFVAFPLSK